MNDRVVFCNISNGRLDKVLATFLGISRNQVQQLLKAELIRVDGITRNASWQLRGGEELAVFYAQTQPDSLNLSCDRDIEVLYEDEYMLILNKPAMLVVHPAPSVREPTLCDWLLDKGYALSTLSGSKRLGIVHRLDKQTSGAIVVAKDNQTHHFLSMQLKNRSMGRYYLAIVNKALREDCMFECYMARSHNNRLKMGKVSPEHGRYSSSLFINLLESQSKGLQSSALLAAKLQTGRTHQIRCHLENMGRSILGDTLYGYHGVYKDRILLHAFWVYFVHPRTSEKLIFKAPVALDMLRYLEQNYDKRKLDETLQLCFVNRFNTAYERLRPNTA